MLELLSFIDMEMISEMLSPKAKADFAEKMIVVAVVWFVMGRKVQGHFKSLEQTVMNLSDKMSKGLNDVALALKEVELAHSKKIMDLEERVDKIEGQVK